MPHDSILQETPAAASLSLAAALRQIEVFSDLSDDQLDWFASNAEDLWFEPGDVLIREGDPADALIVILEGELRGRRESLGADSPTYIGRAGQVTGMLPFSRMTTFPIISRAVLPTRIARLHKDHFDEMLLRIPQLLPRLIGVLADRIRETSRADQQREKLMALGKLSAGLAHELNNPASATRRAAENLRQSTRDLRYANEHLDQCSLSCEQRRFINEFEEKTIVALQSSSGLDSLEANDRQDEVAAWLRGHNIERGSHFASSLVDAGLDTAALDAVAAHFDPAVLAGVLARITASITSEQLTREIEGASGRISELVRAIKEYSYMDQQPEQMIDIHKGIDTTLTMLKFRWKKGVEIKREYDTTLPAVFAHGSELNQIWTNLIDNAIDAMNGKGELRIRTSRELNCVLVEIVDNGPGVPETIRPHIFEPFFTTKGVGEGTGLGLGVVYRIVRAHHGDISLDSKPGQTNFQVRIPFSQQPATAAASTA